MSRNDYRSLISTLVRDQAGTLSADDLDRALSLAVARYSADVERQRVADVVWDAAGFFGPLPDGWRAGCYLLGVEHPVGQQPVRKVNADIYIQPEGSDLLQRLALEEALDVGAVVRVTYCAPHVLSDVEDTIDSGHAEAVASYAAHLLFRQLAAHHSGDRDSSLNADGSNTDSRARNYASRAKECRAAYYAGIGKADPQADKSGGGNGAGTGQTPSGSVGAFAGRPRLGLARLGSVL